MTPWLNEATVQWPPPAVTAGVVAAAYLLGSIPFGYLIVLLREGRDVRSAGSGNIGATNVGRVAGKMAGLLTLALDAGKGFAAVWLASEFSGECMSCVMGAGVAAVAGHMFPVWLKFRGGKGVATAVGAFLPICWQAVAAAAVIFAAVVGVWRYVSLGSILGAASLPVMLWRLYPAAEGPPRVVTYGALLVAALIIVKHKDNIRRLVAGTENRLGKKKLTGGG